MAFVVRHEKVELFGLKQTLSLLHISDLHIWFSDQLLKDIELSISELKPALLLMTGDYFDTPYGAKLFLKFLERVSSNLKVIYVLGNHDLLYGDKIWKRIKELPNCHSLEEADFEYTHEGVVVTFRKYRQKGLNELQGRGSVILVHNPEHIDTKKLSGKHLILAGHLHGGQVVLWKTKAGYHFPGNLLYRHCIGRKSIAESVLIVSNGLRDTLPIRMNCLREIILIELS